MYLRASFIKQFEQPIPSEIKDITNNNNNENLE